MQKKFLLIIQIVTVSLFQNKFMSKTFTIKSTEVDKLVNSWKKKQGQINSKLEKMMNSVVQTVYSTAHSKRPKIDITKENRGKYRVSDPYASAGVPVDTGELQESIQKDVKWQGLKIIGRVFTSNPYAKFVEFGTSRMLPRSFLRSAIHENKEWIKERFRKG